MSKYYNIPSLKKLKYSRLLTMIWSSTILSFLRKQESIFYYLACRGWLVPLLSGPGGQPSLDLAAKGKQFHSFLLNDLRKYLLSP